MACWRIQKLPLEEGARGAYGETSGHGSSICHEPEILKNYKTKLILFSSQLFEPLVRLGVLEQVNSLVRFKFRRNV